MLEIRRLAIEGVLEIRPPRFKDERGFFSESWNAATWSAQGLDQAYVQDNHTLSRSKDVLRGLHWQAPPHAQEKLVRVSRGSVFDVAVDLRTGSATRGRWVGTVLSAEAWNQLLIPAGFAHGFLTLEADTEVQYKVTAPYHGPSDRGIRWDDPDICIDWPLHDAQPVLSEKDRVAPLLRDIDTGF